MTGSNIYLALTTMPGSFLRALSVQGHLCLEETFEIGSILHMRGEERKVKKVAEPKIQNPTS